jgi:purine-binding chemotaxis protein CheW
VETATRRADRSKNLVGFQVGSVAYAVDIQRVHEIINPLPLVQLPHAPDSVLGVADHRGEVIPVIDLRVRFGLPTTELTRRTKWLIVATRSGKAGLVVDGVTEVFGAGPADARSVPKLGRGDETRGLAAVFAYEGGLVFVIDGDRVAAPAEALDLPGIAASMGGSGGR